MVLRSIHCVGSPSDYFKPVKKFKINKTEGI